MTAYSIFYLALIFLAAIFFFILLHFKKKAKKDLAKLKYDFNAQADNLNYLKENKNSELNRLEAFIISISDMTRDISLSTTEKDVFDSILRRTVDFYGSDYCAIFLNDRKSPYLEPISSLGYDEKVLKESRFLKDESSGFIGWAVKSARFISSYEAERDVTLDSLKKFNKIKVLFAQPIMLQNEVIAVICVGNAKKALKQTDITRFMSILASFSSIAISNIRLMNEFKERSVRDSLTGLYNHSYFQNFLEKKIKESKFEKKPVSCVFIDLDYFKNFNDEHGHLAGDALLINFSAILNKNVGPQDIVARYGGEEFVLVLWDKDNDATLALSEKIRSEVVGGVFTYQGKKLKFTFSAGVSSFNPKVSAHDISENELIRLADQALYQAKEEGRNKIIAK